MKLSRTMLTIPDKVIVAVSGGPDSMALLEFCRLGKKNVTALNIHHGTQFSSEAYQLVCSYCEKHDIPLEDTSIPQPEAQTPNKEAYWHDGRAEIYKHMSNYFSGRPVLTAHTLDDAIEWWLLTSFKGNSRLLSYTGEAVNASGERIVLRPALLTDRAELRSFADRHGVPYLDDPTNIGYHNDRARLRTLPLEQMFPYIRGTIRNKLEACNGGSVS